jgi:hypothetical protein
MARIYKTTYEEVYKLHAEFGRVPPSNRDDEYWRGFVKAMNAYSKARNDAFATALLLAVGDELERECRGGGEKQ